MKNLIFLYFVVCIFAFPVWAIAQMVYPINSINDVKGYGEQTANFSMGIFEIDSTTTTKTVADTKEWSIYGNQVGSIDPCQGADCTMIQSKGSNTEAHITSENITRLTGVNVRGNVSMTSMGGLTGCIKANDTATASTTSGSYSQSQTVSQIINGDFYGKNPGLVTGSTTYTGTQNVILHFGQAP
jgi:hypothetical protein